MTSNEINELLTNIISSYAPEFGCKLSKMATKKLPLSGVEKNFERSSSDTYAQAETAFKKCGTVLEANAVDKTISGIIFAGAANLNPAFVVLWIEDNTIHIKASAKEGLVKQHTAEKALAFFEAALDDCDS